METRDTSKSLDELMAEAAILEERLMAFDIEKADLFDPRFNLRKELTSVCLKIATILNQKIESATTPKDKAKILYDMGTTYLKVLYFVIGKINFPEVDLSLLDNISNPENPNKYDYALIYKLQSFFGISYINDHFLNIFHNLKPLNPNDDYPWLLIDIRIFLNNNKFGSDEVSRKECRQKFSVLENRLLVLAKNGDFEAQSTLVALYAYFGSDDRDTLVNDLIFSKKLLKILGYQAAIAIIYDTWRLNDSLSNDSEKNSGRHDLYMWVRKICALLGAELIIDDAQHIYENEITAPGETIEYRYNYHFMKDKSSLDKLNECYLIRRQACEQNPSDANVAAEHIAKYHLVMAAGTVDMFMKEHPHIFMQQLLIDQLVSTADKASYAEKLLAKHQDKNPTPTITLFANTKKTMPTPAIFPNLDSDTIGIAYLLLAQNKNQESESYIKDNISDETVAETEKREAASLAALQEAIDYLELVPPKCVAYQAAADLNYQLHLGLEMTSKEMTDLYDRLFTQHDIKSSIEKFADAYSKEASREGKQEQNNNFKK